MPGVFETLQKKPSLGGAFVLMPFDKAFSALYRVIERCCKEQSLSCRRADSNVKLGKITSSIYEDIYNADIIIADLTGSNPNVFYELGLAHAISDRVVLLTQSIAAIPFDLRDFRCIEYTNTLDGAEELVQQLSKVLATIVAIGIGTSPTNAIQIPTDEAALDEDHQDADDPGMLHILADLAGRRGQKGRARTYLERALVLARSGAGVVAAVSNCAIEAESQQFFDLAQSLYQAALERDPKHVNTAQCYVSFLLDHRSKDPLLLAEAESILNWLADNPERSERTRALRAQLEMVKTPGGVSDKTIDEIMGIIQNQERISMRQLVPLLTIASKTNNNELLYKFLDLGDSKVTDEERWILKRIRADALATGNTAQEDQAIKIYEELVANKHVDSALCSNLAVLYTSRKKSQERACALFLAAYRASPARSDIRKAFVSFLLQIGREVEAQVVLDGKPLPTMKFAEKLIVADSVEIQENDVRLDFND